MKRPHKYGAKPTVVDGVRFPSQKEARRWGELKLLERAGEIRDLRRQVRFALDVNGIPVCHYIADFVYFENHARVVEDAKGFPTPEYRLKAKLMRAVHGVEIRET